MMLNGTYYNRSDKWAYKNAQIRTARKAHECLHSDHLVRVDNYRIYDRDPEKARIDAGESYVVTGREYSTGGVRYQSGIFHLGCALRLGVIKEVEYEDCNDTTRDELITHIKELKKELASYETLMDQAR